MVEASIGGMKLTTTIEKTAFSVNARYAQEYRNSIEALKTTGANNGFGPIPLETVANVKISDGLNDK
jgi:Cu(I)/Ag(I) efflux system membrane protein CusA/SilA